MQTFIMRYLCYVFLFVLLNGCASNNIVPKVLEQAAEDKTFKVEQKEISKKFAGVETIRRLAKKQGQKSAYQLGPGDAMDISVWKRPDISQKRVIVAPDGVISVPKVGIIDVNGKSISDLTEQIRQVLAKNYENPEVTITVREFHNNKAFVLGRVTEPGVVNFPGDGTLLEALALAGGLPHIGKDTFLTKCAIIRGKDTVIWIDLRDLLDNGNMALNARIINNDVIFIPEAEDEMVMVMGEVENPGPILLKRGLNLLDAVIRAGGYTENANPEKVFIIRPLGITGHIRQVKLKTMLETGNFKQNYALLEDDIIVVSSTGMHKFNYALEQLLPSLKVLSLSTGIIESLGLSEKVLSLETDE